MGFETECRGDEDGFEHTFREPNESTFDGLSVNDNDYTSEELVNSVWREVYHCDELHCHAHKHISWLFPVSQFEECCDEVVMNELEPVTISDHRGIEDGPIAVFRCQNCGKEHKASKNTRRVTERT